MKPLTEESQQAIAPGPNGRFLRRWYVWTGDRMKVTWKETEAEALHSVPGADRVEPAPPMVR